MSLLISHHWFKLAFWSDPRRKIPILQLLFETEVEKRVCSYIHLGWNPICSISPSIMFHLFLPGKQSIVAVILGGVRTHTPSQHVNVRPENRGRSGLFARKKQTENYAWAYATNRISAIEIFPMEQFFHIYCVCVYIYIYQLWLLCFTVRH